MVYTFCLIKFTPNFLISLLNLCLTNYIIIVVWKILREINCGIPHHNKLILTFYFTWILMKQYRGFKWNNKLIWYCFYEIVGHSIPKTKRKTNYTAGVGIMVVTKLNLLRNGNSIDVYFPKSCNVILVHWHCSLSKNKSN